MRTFLKNLFINNWPRKCLSIILAIISWVVVNKSLTTTKTISHIPIRIENIPPGKTIDGIQSNGFLNRKVNLTITGSKDLLDDLNAHDIFVALDASGQERDWIATISRKNIRSDTLDTKLFQRISLVSQQNFIVKLTNLVSEKIPITITQPIGHAPKGYQFIDIWPYQLYTTISGPENMIKKLKTHGLKLTFNLSDITLSQLDELHATKTQKHSDVVSFFVPNSWKYISLPPISSTPVEINDPDAKYLRIDFLRHELFRLDTPIPLSLYFPPNTISFITPSNITLAADPIIEDRNGIKVFSIPLYVRGVSALFLDLIKDMLEVVIVVSPNEDGSGYLNWGVQLISSRALEDRYVHLLTSDVSNEEFRDLQPQLREKLLRNRFRNFMNRMQIYKNAKEKFEIYPTLRNNMVWLNESKGQEPQTQK